MRNLIFVAIKDLAVGAFMAPSPQQSAAAAIRSFVDMMNDDKSEISKHPEDYELYQLAEWDDSTGYFFTSFGDDVARPSVVNSEQFEEWTRNSYRPRLLLRGVEALRPKQ